MSLICDQLKHHKFIASEQRNAYKFKKENIEDDELMVLMDFKENIKLGRGPIEIGNDFYCKKQCSVLGFAVVYKDQVTKQPCLEYIDFFSDILSHDALFVSGCIKKILNKFLFNNSMGQSKIRKVHFWNDTGRHFQCAELAHFLLNFVPFEFNVQVTSNFFGEHHGKSILDGHFGLLSRLIKDIEKEQYLGSIQNLIGSLKGRINEINRQVTKIRASFFIYEREERNKYLYLLNIKNLCDYNFFESVFSDNKIRIRSKFRTNSGEYIENLKTTIKKVEDQRKTKRASTFKEVRVQKTSSGWDATNIFGENITRRYKRQSQFVNSVLNPSLDPR